MPQTVNTMTLASIPEGSRPEEFLTGAGLEGMYARELAAMAADDPQRSVIEAAHRAARKAAAAEAESVAEYTEKTAAELAAAGKKNK